jgi:hypothetical protein
MRLSMPAQSGEVDRNNRAFGGIRRLCDEL